MNNNQAANRFELSFEQQQFIDHLSLRANTPGSNQNKYRFALYAHIEELVNGLASPDPAASTDSSNPPKSVNPTELRTAIHNIFGGNQDGA